MSLNQSDFQVNYVWRSVKPACKMYIYTLLYDTINSKYHNEDSVTGTHLLKFNWCFLCVCDHLTTVPSLAPRNHQPFNSHIFPCGNLRQRLEYMCNAIHWFVSNISFHNEIHDMMRLKATRIKSTDAKEIEWASSYHRLHTNKSRNRKVWANVYDSTPVP